MTVAAGEPFRTRVGVLWLELLAMKAMDDALLAAAREGRVRPEDAAAKAHDKPRFQSLLSGGATSA